MVGGEPLPPPRLPSPPRAREHRQSASSGGVVVKESINITPLLVVITIVFAALKGAGAISWGWAWVLSPLWIPFAVALAIFVVVFVFITVVRAGQFLVETLLP